MKEKDQAASRRNGISFVADFGDFGADFDAGFGEVIVKDLETLMSLTRPSNNCKPMQSHHK